jgi:hypothetical protein
MRPALEEALLLLIPSSDKQIEANHLGKLIGYHAAAVLHATTTLRWTQEEKKTSYPTRSTVLVVNPAKEIADALAVTSSRPRG